MKTYRNNHKRSRFRSNDRNFKRNGDSGKYNSDYSSNVSFQRKVPGRNNHNASKLIDKYNDLAREALSNGDKILSENYFQHADHFARILGDRQVVKNENTESENTANEINATNGDKESIKEETLNSKEQNSSEN